MPSEKIETTADNQSHARGFRGFPSAHDPRERVAIDNTQGIDAKRCSRGEQLLRRTRTAQEREMCGDLQFGISHPNTPWRNQRCEPVSVSTPSPARYTQ